MVKMNKFYSINDIHKKRGNHTPNKIIEKYKIKPKKISAKTKVGRHQRTVTTFISCPQSLLEGQSDISEPTMEAGYLNRKINELESSLHDKESSLLSLNIDYNKLASYRRQFEKIKEENRKSKRIIQNLKEKEIVLKDLQIKNLKMRTDFQKLKQEYSKINSTLKGIEMKLSQEKAQKHEYLGKLSRADQDNKRQFEINQNLYEEN